MGQVLEHHAELDVKNNKVSKGDPNTRCRGVQGLPPSVGAWAACAKCRRTVPTYRACKTVGRFVSGQIGRVDCGGGVLQGCAVGNVGGKGDLGACKGFWSCGVCDLAWQRQLCCQRRALIGRAAAQVAREVYCAGKILRYLAL